MSKHRTRLEKARRKERKMGGAPRRGRKVMRATSSRDVEGAFEQYGKGAAKFIRSLSKQIVNLQVENEELKRQFYIDLKEIQNIHEQNDRLQARVAELEGFILNRFAVPECCGQPSGFDCCGEPVPCFPDEETAELMNRNQAQSLAHRDARVKAEAWLDGWFEGAGDDIWYRDHDENGDLIEDSDSYDLLQKYLKEEAGEKHDDG